MERWSGRVAVVTGASAGIGAAVVKDLVVQGMKVVGLARRVEKIEAMKADLGQAADRLYPLQCDITKEADILAAFEWVKTNLGGVDVLVNNAGVFKVGKITDGSTADWSTVLDTNVLGLCICTREAVKSMTERSVDDGHIININSVIGHKVVNHPGVALYAASKYAVTALTQALQHELASTHIKATSISPGLVRTEIIEASNSGMGNEIYDTLPCLEPSDVSNSVVYALSLPPNVQPQSAMERWSGRVALVTGASAGIGAAIAKELVLRGMKVVGAARRVERVEALKADLSNAPGQLYPLPCDVSKEEDILAAFEWIKKNLGGVDVLVNNAGIGRTDLGLIDSPTDRWRQTFDVNVLGLSICTREAVKAMRARGVDDGHIIHINSVAGHGVSDLPGVGMYAASKYGVTALTEALRKELVTLKSHIRVSSISPGSVRTDIMIAAGRANTQEPYDHMACMQPKDIADAVVYVLGTPPHVQVHELTIKPVGELF